MSNVYPFESEQDIVEQASDWIAKIDQRSG